MLVLKMLKYKGRLIGTRVLIRKGNSLAVTLPREIVDKFQLDKSYSLVFYEVEDLDLVGMTTPAYVKLLMKSKKGKIQLYCQE